MDAKAPNIPITRVETKMYFFILIDFKTDSFNASTQTLDQWKQDRAQYHASQLSAYAQVIAREHSIALENISLHLVLLHANTTAQAQLLPTSND